MNESLKAVLDDSNACYDGDSLTIEEVAVRDIAERVGTPAYIYSQAVFSRQYLRLTQAMEGLNYGIHFAVKANSNLAVLKHFAQLGSGFDIVSAGELSRVIAAGGEASKVIFSGVGKSSEEIDFALKNGVGCFNIESTSELERVAERARMSGAVAAVAVRINPDVDPNTHPYISTGLKENKFGVLQQDAIALYRKAATNENLCVKGIACHIGSQINDLGPLLEALGHVLDLVDKLANEGISITHIDLGGGFGVRYQNESPLDIQAWGAGIKSMLAGRDLHVSIEPGRFLTANAGTLVTRVEYLKHASKTDQGSNKNFAVVDAAMNDLLRPSLYQAWHGIAPAKLDSSASTLTWDIVGPICESGDFLAKERDLALTEGDILAVLSAGAYGSVLASNYNTRGRAPEILIDGSSFKIIRRRETINDLLRTEIL